MQLLYFIAHAGEDHPSEAEAVFHVAADKTPLIAISVVALVSLLIAARFLSLAAKEDQNNDMEEQQ